MWLVNKVISRRMRDETSQESISKPQGHLSGSVCLKAKVGAQALELLALLSRDSSATSPLQLHSGSVGVQATLLLRCAKKRCYIAMATIIIVVSVQEIILWVVGLLVKKTARRFEVLYNW